MKAASQIPTAIESGLQDFVMGSYQGLLAPAGTPPEVVRWFNGAVVEILRSEEISAKLVDLRAEVVADLPEQFGEFLREDGERRARVV